MVVLVFGHSPRSYVSIEGLKNLKNVREDFF
jgi:hypothetical protein